MSYAAMFGMTLVGPSKDSTANEDQRKGQDICRKKLSAFHHACTTYPVYVVWLRAFCLRWGKKWEY